MEKHNIKICRLCLSILENENFEVLEELRAEMLVTVLNNFNPFVSYNAIICGNCNSNLQKCYDFKMMCLNNQDCPKTFINVNDPLKVNLEDVRELFEDGKRLEGKKMCRLCFSLNSDYFANMNEVIEEDKSVGNMLMSCIPELNLDMTNEHSVCQPCLCLLKTHLTFMQHCLKLEEKINLYCKLKRKGNYDIIDLYDVRQFFEKMQIENSSERNIPTQENETNPPIEVVFIKVENVEMKVEDNSENVDTYREEENLNLLNSAEEESTTTVEGQINARSDITDPDKTFNCSKCSYTAKYNYALKRHMIVHKNPSELQMFKCTICTYESRRKMDLKFHMYTHSTEPFKCEYCPFESKNFRIATRHMGTHKAKHSQKNESPPERRLFQCISCKFATHTKDNLTKHSVVHKDIPENEMFTCYTCNFKCKQKKHLKQHMLIHNNPSKEVFKCKECGYMTKMKNYFKNHLKRHKEVQTFSCTLCNFQTRWKQSLTDHMSQHVSPSEMVHKCEKCSYSSNTPRNLNRHIKRVHSKNSLELPKLTSIN